MIRLLPLLVTVWCFRNLIALTISEKVSDNTPIPPPDWEALIALTADEILAERSPARLLQVRARLYDLLTHCIPPTTIIKVCHTAQVDNKCIY